MYWYFTVWNMRKTLMISKKKMLEYRMSVLKKKGASCWAFVLRTTKTWIRLSENRREFPNFSASPGMIPAVTPTPGWDGGAQSETRPWKTGFHSHSPAHGATYLSKIFPWEKLQALFGPGRREVGRTQARWEIYRQVEPGGRWCQTQTPAGIKYKVHEKKRKTH